jgi:ATP-dependent DNA helicase RecG
MEDILQYMKLAIDVMKKSVQEPRNDKTSPKVGAVLVKPDGTVETAYRGELRQGDHAEFTLIERKNRDKVLDNCILFATLEPCAPGARKPPKLSCSERIVNARIKKVWIGIEDPDPMVDRKGIKYLIDNGVEVEMFPPELQQIIRDVNKQFIKEAEDRAKEIVKEKDYSLTLK